MSLRSASGGRPRWVCSRSFLGWPRSLFSPPWVWLLNTRTADYQLDLLVWHQHIPSGLWGNPCSTETETKKTVMCSKWSVPPTHNQLHLDPAPQYPSRINLDCGVAGLREGSHLWTPRTEINTTNSNKEIRQGKGAMEEAGALWSSVQSQQLCWGPCCVCAPFHFVYSYFHFLLRNYDTTLHFLYKFSLSTFCFWHTAQYVGRVLPANNQLFSWQKITCQQVTFKFQILMACQKRDVVFKILMWESSVSAHIDVNVKTKRTCFLPWWTELLEFLMDFNHKTE